MRNLDLFGTIDACICTLDSLNHLIEDEDFVAAVEKVALFMNPGGILYLMSIPNISIVIFWQTILSFLKQIMCFAYGKMIQTKI